MSVSEREVDFLRILTHSLTRHRPVWTSAMSLSTLAPVSRDFLSFNTGHIPYGAHTHEQRQGQANRAHIGSRELLVAAVSSSFEQQLGVSVRPELSSSLG
ncbi:uncharacterized protein BO96DRAFT_439785 [Aspergillus niger CBS 101883]|uniref:uncharacterized protein n=1 Tax=Aspergillus lacticoffeatus (strain CBS 101883) TaxID=1450533 RepID=UPI000D803ACB|nr:uncharacterized protein BO96DRAFT_439785 [Aspergillus niger CBS 101883]PYH50595.1 hypothetical protein BO96DRAFT_439785 [Aspergillus niger CBS 101883]